MISYIIFRPGYGDADLCVRRRRRSGASQEYWNFTTGAWVSSESSATKVFLTEVVDSTFSSFYSLTTALPNDTTGTYVEEVYQVSTGDILQQNLPAAGLEEYSGTGLQDILDLVLQRASALKLVAKIPFMDAANLAMDLIYKRLLLKKSDFLRESFSRSFLADVNSCILPTDFFGLAERPYFSGLTALLTPLPVETRQVFTTSGTPRYYELRGTSLVLYPTPSTPYTLLGEYWQRPVKFAAVSDIVPLNGLIDYILADAIIRISETGMGVLADPTFRQSIYTQLEELLPQRAPRQVSWGHITERRGGGHPDYWGDI